MVPSVCHVLVGSVLVMALAQTVTARRRQPYVPGKIVPQQISQTTPETGVPSPVMLDIERRIVDVEASTKIMKEEMTTTKEANHRLREQVTSMTESMEALDVANKRVLELERLLGKFEKFFGVLYTDLPDVFAREMTVERRVSALNQYIGDREADLMALRPNPPTEKAVPGENPVDEEMVGTIVRELGSENAKLRRRLDDVENKMVGVPGGGKRIFGDSLTATTTRTDEEFDDLEERVERLERIVELAVAPLIGEDSGGQSRGIGRSRRQVAGAEGTTLSDEDRETLTEEVNILRSISSTRKSIFSAISTEHAYGEAGVHVPLTFDLVNVNKGEDFHNNSIFVCEIRGFYFFTFTVRASDHYYIGVNLLLNGERITSVYCESDPVQNHMVTQSAALHLNAGDNVWLTIAPSTNFAVYSDANKYSTFSGFLLFKGS